MKSILIACCFLFTQQQTWLTDFEQGLSIAKEKKQLVLLNFSGSDWCVPCIRMKKEVFESDDFIKYSLNNLALVKADFPRNKKSRLSAAQLKHNEALAEKFNPNGRFPYTLLLDADGKILKTWDGCPDGKPEVFVDQIRKIQFKQ